MFRHLARMGALAVVLGQFCFNLSGQTSTTKNVQSGIKGGIRPTTEDGRVLNLDFEKGDLSDWTAEGEAFRNQPIEGDAVAKRRNDMKSGHQGRFWVGSFERGYDAPQGTLTSVPFKVTQPWASFLVGGGSTDATCVEIIDVAAKKPIVRVAGLETENMSRFALDLRPHQGKMIQIRLVDRYSGGWGHLNFDDFVFHATKPAVPNRNGQLVAAPPDEHKFSGLSPQDAAKAMTVPDGFEVTLFAGEPDVHQPIALAMDDQGRLWVAEAFCYPIRRPAKEANDRIVFFEDTNHDGKFDKRTVFIEGLNLVSGFEIGNGGVWVGAAPEFLFIPWDETRTKPAGPPRVLLDGWGYQDTHETLNAFIWGPDGWLWGCHGVFTHSRVGKPGTPDKDRVPLNAAIWRYHPTRHEFEIVCHGTSNPWGLDFNDVGEAFVEACVIPHAFHILPQARYLRQAGVHFNPFTFADIDTIADHRHYLGANPHGGNNRSDSAGGGHAHCGTMIYQGGSWPAEYRNGFFMGNVHGRRINMDILKEQGSGYVAAHGPDFLMANDAYARFINMRYGPDGNVFLIDWYDKQACHSPVVDVHDRTNGRIYKISHRSAKPVTVDLVKESSLKLVEYQLHPNDWFVRHSRRLLGERGADPAVHEAIKTTVLTHTDPTRRLRGLWALHATQGIDDATIARLLDDPNEHVRGWTIRLAGEIGKTAPVWKRLEAFASIDPSAVVRRELASLAAKTPPSQRWNIIEGLATHKEDLKDANLPLLGWYALEPLLDIDAPRAVKLALSGPPIWGQFAVRKLSIRGKPAALDAVVQALEWAPGRQAEFLTEMRDSLRGRKGIEVPSTWQAAYPKLAASKNQTVRDISLVLATGWGDPRAIEQLRGLLVDPKQPAARRREALAALVLSEPRGLGRVLAEIISKEKDADKLLVGDAIKAMANFDHNDISPTLIKAYASFDAAQQRDVLATLASRPNWGQDLLKAVQAKKIPRTDVGADLVRQLRNLGNPELDRQIADIWGIVRQTAADKKKRMEEVRLLVNGRGASPDLAEGRHLYQKVCASCHTLYGTGGKVGPELTGSNRSNLDYLLENILDPSAVIPKEYAVSVLALNNGRLITGIVTQETSDRLTVVTANETLTIAKPDVEGRRASDQSMMPDNLLQNLSEAEVRSLVAYMRNQGQTPIQGNKETLKDFFNGKDLTGWVGDAKLWSVENGEIVGKSPGIKRNQFLVSQMDLRDFRLQLKVKLTPNSENSGIQIRSVLLPDGEMKGPQADAGKGWWGKLYEESGRGLLWDKSAEQNVKEGEWNDYVIEAVGPTIKTWINGKPAVNLTDDKVSKRGQIGFQIHSGGAMEVRFKDLQLSLVEPSTQANSK